MKITIEYPQVMKMALFEELEVPDTATIQEVKEKILNSFWNLFNKMWSHRAKIHGQVKDVTLKDGDTVLTSDEMLRGKTKIQAVFFERQHAV